jgi:hypothetical protein
MNLQIDPEKIKQLIADLEAEANEDKLASYKPYLKQVEFHAAGAKHRERLLMAGNQNWKDIGGRNGNRLARYRTLSRLVAGQVV